jgi:hypothetical protein
MRYNLQEMPNMNVLRQIFAGWLVISLAMIGAAPAIEAAIKNKPGN